MSKCSVGTVTLSADQAQIASLSGVSLLDYARLVYAQQHMQPSLSAYSNYASGYGSSLGSYLFNGQTDSAYAKWNPGEQHNRELANLYARVAPAVDRRTKVVAVMGFGGWR